MSERARLMASAPAILNPDMPDDHTTYALLVQDLLLAERELRLTERELEFVLLTKKQCPPMAPLPRWFPRERPELLREPSRITVDFSRFAHTRRLGDGTNRSKPLSKESLRDSRPIRRSLYSRWTLRFVLRLHVVQKRF